MAALREYVCIASIGIEYIGEATDADHARQLIKDGDYDRSTILIEDKDIDRAPVDLLTYGDELPD